MNRLFLPPGEDAPPPIMGGPPPQNAPALPVIPPQEPGRNVRVVTWRTGRVECMIYTSRTTDRGGEIPMAKAGRAIVTFVLVLIVLVIGWMTAHPKTVPCDFCGEVVSVWYKTDFVPEYATPLARIASAVTSVKAVPSHTHYEVCPSCYERVMAALVNARE